MSYAHAAHCPVLTCAYGLPGHVTAREKQRDDSHDVESRCAFAIGLGAWPVLTHRTALLLRGDIFGEYSLFEDTTWQTSMGYAATLWCYAVRGTDLG
eukprot:3931596-Rhodomonas_salina.3